TWFYIHVIQGPAPEKLSFSARDAATTTTSAGSSSTTSTTASTASPTTTAAGASASGLAGTWTATSDSQVGYRVKEVLFGQSTEAVGRTNSVTGQLAVDGSGVKTAAFTVDLTTVASDNSQ